MNHHFTGTFVWTSAVGPENHAHFSSPLATALHQLTDLQATKTVMGVCPFQHVLSHIISQTLSLHVNNHTVPSKQQADTAA